MNANDGVPAELAVIAFDDDGDFFFVPHHLGICDRHAETAGELEANMFIFGMTVEVPCRRLQDVRGRNAPGRNAPSVFLQEKSRFRLSAREAELPGIAR